METFNANQVEGNEQTNSQHMIMNMDMDLNSASRQVVHPEPQVHTQRHVQVDVKMEMDCYHQPQLHHHQHNTSHQPNNHDDHYRHHDHNTSHSSAHNHNMAPRSREIYRRQLRQTHPPIMRGDLEYDLFSGMRALGEIGNESDQFLNPIREPRWAHEQRLLDLMDENTALAMFTAYSDEDTWINGEKSLCGSSLPKYYYQQEIERTVQGWIEEERKHVESLSRSSSINSNSERMTFSSASTASASSSSTVPLCELSTLSFSRGPSAPSPHLNSSHDLESAMLRRASISSERSSYLPELSPVGVPSRAVSVPTATRSIQNGR